jgi:hypothetical protein
MTLIDVQNKTRQSTIVPARGGFGIVLGPGERGTVCPEGIRGQGRFHDMVSRGVIAERSRLRSRELPVITLGHSHDGFDRAA